MSCSSSAAAAVIPKSATCSRRSRARIASRVVAMVWEADRRGRCFLAVRRMSPLTPAPPPAPSPPSSQAGASKSIPKTNESGGGLEEVGPGAGIVSGGGK